MPLTRVPSRPSTRCFHPVSSFDFRRLYRAPSRSPPLDPFGASRLPGFSSLFTTSPKRVHIRGASQSIRLVPSTGDHSLPTVYSSLGLRGLFHPRAMSRDGSAFRGFSLRVARRPHQASWPPCRCRPSARPDLTIRRPPSDASASRRCSTRSSVRTGSVLSLTGSRSPLRVRSPPGSLRYGWGCGFPAALRSRHFNLRGSLARTTHADAPSVSPP